MKLLLSTIACALLLQVQARSFTSNLPIVSSKRVLETPSLADALRGFQTGDVKRLQYLLDMRNAGDSANLNRGECAYEGYPDTSTMCLYSASPDASDMGISAEDIIAIVESHNSYRSSVNPTAENMQKMMWDENIAVIAQHYANSCPWEHDDNTNRQVPGYGIFIGQNLAWGYGSWDAAITGWHSEVSMMIFGHNVNDISDVGHYTQVVRHESARVGCGYAYCGSWKTYVCNYAFINMVNDFYAPYTAGDSCAQCPDSCSNNLCDCAGKVCLNGGRLDINTCECSCTGVFYGEFCLEGGSTPIPEVPEHDLSGATSEVQEEATFEFACPYMQGNGPGGGGPGQDLGDSPVVENSDGPGSSVVESEEEEEVQVGGGPGGGGPVQEEPEVVEETNPSGSFGSNDGGRPRAWKIIA